MQRPLLGSPQPARPEAGSSVLSILPDPAALVKRQIEGARQLLTRDLTTAPRWPWPSLDRVVGPLLGGDLHVLGGEMGNGKSSLLMSLMDGLARKKTPTLYFPLEIDPQVCRLHWVAWRLNLNRTHVVRHEWKFLPKHAEEFVNEGLAEQQADPCIHFATPRRMTGAALRNWIDWGVKKCGAKLIIIDHFHRLLFNMTDGARWGATETARELRDIARSLDVPIIAAAHLNREGGLLSKFYAPGMHRLKETGALGEEADVVLMVSRKLKPAYVGKSTERLAAVGAIDEASMAVFRRMVVTCRKHRLDGDQIDAKVELHCELGHVSELLDNQDH